MLRRVAILTLVLAVHFGLLLLLLRLAPPHLLPPAVRTSPLLVRLIPEARVAPARTRTERAPRAQGTATARAPEEKVTPEPPARPPAQARVPSNIWSQVTPITGEEFAAADIARVPSRQSATPGDGGSSSRQLGGDTTGPGTGPNGEPLYNAQWYRRPTPAELSFYIPAGAPRTGWGIIACQTVADYRVDNCREIAQSPAGSGLAGAVRQAAWQFRVLPPRLGGKPMIGAWVRIRIDYTDGGAQ